MITAPNTNPRREVLKGAKVPKAFVRVLKVVAKVEPEDTRTVLEDDEDYVLIDSEGCLIRA